VLLYFGAAALPLLPLITAAPGSWRTPAVGWGDVRAVVNISTEDITSGGVATAQIFWRRRDANPDVKAVVVAFAGNYSWTLLGLNEAAVSSDCCKRRKPIGRFRGGCLSAAMQIQALDAMS